MRTDERETAARRTGALIALPYQTYQTSGPPFITEHLQ